MRALLVVALLVAGCGGAVDTTAVGDASADADSATIPDVAALDVDSSDGQPETSTSDACAYAAGCCVELGDVECVNGGAYVCEPFDDAGGLGWFASDGGTCNDQ